jgi:ABC-type sugar transport system permease subunit
MKIFKSGFSQNKNIEGLTGYLFVLPDFIGLIIFVIAPIIFAFYLSFYQWDLISPKVFIGLKNYSTLLQDQAWWASMLTSLKFTLLYVPSLLGLALFFAFFIDHLEGKAVNLVRTSFLMPYAITSVTASILWMFLYTDKIGFINMFFRLVNLPTISFLGDTRYALVSIVAVIVWINLGYNMIIFLSAIKEIPRENTEAAELDGANLWQIFVNITIPGIKDTLVYLLVTSVIISFQMLDYIIVMTKGGPADSTQVAALYIFNQSFTYFKMGYGAALSVVLFIILMFVSITQLSVLSKER